MSMCYTVFMKKILTHLENGLEKFFVKTIKYSLPKNLKEAIVKYLPYFLVVVLIITIPFAVLGLLISLFTAIFSLFDSIDGWSTIFSAGYVVVLAVATPGLFNRKVSSWRMLFYLALVSFVFSFVRAVINFDIADMAGFILIQFLSFYLLFQVREKYS